MTSHQHAAVPLPAAALAALAVPARFAILRQLLDVGPQTASQCAVVVGETPSNCSWHLRALAKAGLVERVEDADGDARRRPWRATAGAYDLSGEPDPAARALARTVGMVMADFDEHLYRRAIAAEPGLPDDWRAVSGAHSWSLLLTATELAAVTSAIEDVIAPYRQSTRTHPPTDVVLTAMSLRAFPHPDR